MDPLQLGSDSAETLVEALQCTTAFLIAQLTAIHFQKMTCCLQCLKDSGGTGARDVFGERKRGQPMRVRSILAGLVEFALQVQLSDLQIPQGHADVFVAKQLH